MPQRHVPLTQQTTRDPLLGLFSQLPSAQKPQKKHPTSLSKLEFQMAASLSFTARISPLVTCASTTFYFNNNNRSANTIWYFNIFVYLAKNRQIGYVHIQYTPVKSQLIGHLPTRNSDPTKMRLTPPLSFTTPYPIQFMSGNLATFGKMYGNLNQ